MKVLDLQCGHQHVFEGWFGSEDDFQDQQRRGLVQCPMCGDSAIAKRLSAPRLNLGNSREKAGTNSSGSSPEDAGPAKQSLVSGSPTDQALAMAWMAVARRIIESTDDVGDKFAEEARKIHYGETKERGIRGQASADETQALLDEGIAVAPLFVPDALKGPIQ